MHSQSTTNDHLFPARTQGHSEGAEHSQQGEDKPSSELKVEHISSSSSSSSTFVSTPADRVSIDIQLPRGRGMLELVGMWGALAPRLPPQASPKAELLLSALKLAVAHSNQLPSPAAALGPSTAQYGAPQPASATANITISGEGSSLSQTLPGAFSEVCVGDSCVLTVASRLADISTSGIPIDTEAIAASMLAGAAASGRLHLREIEAKLGPVVAQLVADVLRVRSLPDRVDLYDDETSRYVIEKAEHVNVHRCGSEQQSEQERVPVGSPAQH